MPIALQAVILVIFVMISITTLLGIVHVKPFDRIQPRYLAAMFAAVVTPLVAIVIAAGQDVFSPIKVEHYLWEISYPSDLEERFVRVLPQDEEFMAFYSKHRVKALKTIKDASIPAELFETYVDKIFVMKKAADFSGRTAKGELFIIRNDEGPSYGKAVLTFPGERQPTAFNVKTDPRADGPWRLRFEQPIRWVDYEGRLNKWKPAELTVNFSESDGVWTGNLNYGKIEVGEFMLDPS